jgi:hypothetical protein
MNLDGIGALNRSKALLARSQEGTGSRAIRAFTDIIQAVARSATGGLGSTLGGSGVSLGIDNSYAEVLKTQMEFQQQMQLISLESNRLRTDHEAKMTVIRNTRAG